MAEKRKPGRPAGHVRNTCPRRGSDTSSLHNRQVRELTPERRAALGLSRWPWPVWEGALLLATVCPRCHAGLILLQPPTRAGERVMPAPLVPCGPRGWGLRCPPHAVREAWQAVMSGRPAPIDHGDAERLGRLLPQLLPALWRGRTGRDPRRALWACRRTLEEFRLAPPLVGLALRALAHRRRWPEALVATVLDRKAAT